MIKLLSRRSGFVFSSRRSRLQAPAPATAKYRNTKKYSTASSPPFRIGHGARISEEEK